MVDTTNSYKESDDTSSDLFVRIADDLYTKGFSINPAVLPLSMSKGLFQQISTMGDDKFNRARIGRDQQLMKNQSIRRDEISWIAGNSEAERDWLQWTSELQVSLNRRLLLGLFSFESHFSHYAKGDFYKRHLDAYKGGNANRVVSVVVYLNPNWLPEHGGELALFSNESDQVGIKVTPSFGTVLVFLSEEFPHEVLTTHSDRYSIAGWFRVNSSTNDRIDPPA